jgi:hypothetical protein
LCVIHVQHQAASWLVPARYWVCDLVKNLCIKDLSGRDIKRNYFFFVGCMWGLSLMAVHITRYLLLKMKFSQKAWTFCLIFVGSKMDSEQRSRDNGNIQAANRSSGERQ